MTKVWFTSDTHFSHFNILDYTGRPYQTTMGMEYDIVEKWNRKVSPEDIVYFLGDFTLKGEETIVPILKKLNGRIVLIKGNHDRKNCLHLFTEVYNSLYIVLGDSVIELVHNPRNAKQDADMVFCGHVHEIWKEKQELVRIYNVGVDVRNFEPVSFEEIVSSNTAKEEEKI